MAFAYCPDCSARIYLGRKPWIGQPTTCDYCEADLAVVQVNPPRLDWSDGDWEDESELEPSYSVTVQARP